MDFDIRSIWKYDCYEETFQALVKPAYDAETYLFDYLEEGVLDYGKRDFLLTVPVDVEKLKTGDCGIRFLFAVEPSEEGYRIMYLHMVCL